MDCRRRRLSTVVVLLMVPGCALGTPLEKYVRGGWTWFTDYAYLSSEWTLNSQPSCKLEVARE
jgi:hypothetical protein